MVAVGVPYCLLASPLDLALSPRGESPGGERNARLIVGWDIHALAVLATLALLWMLLPLGVCLREVLRSRHARKQSAEQDPDPGRPIAG